MKKMVFLMAMLLTGSIAIFFNKPFTPSAQASPAITKARTENLDGIEPYLTDDDMSFSVFYSRLDKSPRRTFLYHSQKMRAASMIKVFILGKAMQQILAGDMRLEDTIILTDYDKVGGSGILTGYEEGTTISIYDLLFLMITESDNTTTNIMIDYLGMDQINHYIAEEGYSDTILQRKMMDFDAVAEGRENYTSVYDLGTFFARLYDHQCVSPQYDNLMIEILKGQTDTEGIPTALPNAIVAHKTGELGGVYNDGGIVFDEHDSILVFMTDDYPSREDAIASVIRVSRYLVYDFEK